MIVRAWTLVLLLAGMVGGAQEAALGTEGTSKGATAEPVPTVQVAFSQLRPTFRPPVAPYPPLARLLGIQGAVTLQLTVGPSGVPERVEALDGPALLRPVMCAMFMRWRFEPPILEGKPARFESLVKVPFELEGGVYPKGKAPLQAVLLDLSEGWGSTLTPEDMALLRDTAKAWLGSLGLQCVEPAGADPENTVHLKIEIETTTSVGGNPQVHLRERCSLLADRNLGGNKSGQPQRIYFFRHLIAMRKNLPLRESLVFSLKDLLNELLPSPISRASLQAEMRRTTPPSILNDLERVHPPVTDFNFSQIKVKRQPPPPPYPMTAKINRIQGTVLIEVIIDPSGQPIRAEAIEGPNELRGAAADYALQWEFLPALLKGVPQYARFRLTMPFRLH